MSFDELGDDFAGDEANEEWDAAWAAYTAGADTNAAASAPLCAALRLPTGRVELRGDLDDETVALFVDLHDHRAPLTDLMGGDESSDVLGFVVRTDSTTTSGWTLERVGDGVVAEGVGHSPLAEALWVQLHRASLAIDTRHLHLDASCVQVDDVGVVLAGGTTTERDAVLHALLADGASYLTRDDLVLQPGTRAVLGTPTPFGAPGLDDAVEVDPPGPRLVPASAVAPVLTHVAVGVVVLLTDATQVGSSQVVPVSAQDAVVQLLATTPSIGGVEVPDVQPLTETALELLSLLVAGATCVQLDASDPVAAAATIAQLRAPDSRQLVVPFTADADSSGQRRRFVRFDSGGLVDEGDGVVIAVTAATADELESSWRARGTRALPEAFGLPDCPTGDVARRQWAERSLPATAPATSSTGTESRDINASDTIGGIPTGVAVELVTRDLVEVNDAHRRRVIDDHEIARATNDVVVGILLNVLDAASSIDVAPVVVGAVAQAHDGPLPEHLTDIDRIDLLIRGDHIEKLAEILEARGYLSDPRSLSGSALHSASDLRLRHHAHPTIEIDLHRTLAAGPFGELVDPEEFHQRAVPFRLADRWALALHPEHRFVHACVRADRAGERERVAELRDVVTSAPRAESLLAEVMECSARWGATTSVLAVVRHADGRFPGVPPWLVQRTNTAEGRTPRRLRRRSVRG